MKTYTKPILMAAAIFSAITSCSKSDADGRFSDNPKSEIGTPQAGTPNTAKQIKWNFDNTNDWINASQGVNADISQTSVESNTDAEDGKVVKIFTKSATKERKKLKSKKQYGAGLYTWRTYISDLGTNERVSIGSWLWNSDKHELDFEVGSGTSKDRESLKTADDEVVTYITSQDNPALHQKVKIKKNAWHTFQIDLKLVNGKYFATWLIDGVKCAAQQLNYGEEHPFYIFCSTENLKFVGDSWPYKDNYGLWDYVAYTPYTYSGDPKEPQNQVNPVDPEPDPDTGEVKTWTFNSFPNDWNRWARADVDNNNKIVNGKLVLTTSANCSVSKIFNKTPAGYGKYTCSIRLPEVNKSAKIQLGMTFYNESPERFFIMMARYGDEAERKRLGAKKGELLLFIQSVSPAIEQYVAVLKPNRDYKFTIDIKKVGNNYGVEFSLDQNVVKSLAVANFGEDQIKFEWSLSAESNRGSWLPGETLVDGEYSAIFNFIEYTAY
ncbi:toxin-antitoxin system protein [Capnocytophaga sputigena]|uniref:toxin-antitoxin system protein n=1 Tax=Capnocytophaga sputigena TaxID=1019 RepID=UPI0028EBFCD3|nr:toxin-antitoxin system protein [Capnocytophaga sputigena]